LICTPDGKLIHCSEVLIGANNQSNWNKQNYRQGFENKFYGVAGDAGFTFNHEVQKSDKNEIPIYGFTPHRKMSIERTKEQKRFNRIRPSIQVVVENVIAQLKKWRIVKGVFRHLSVNFNNQINSELVIRVLVKLTAEKLENHPLRSPK
jgi:hypothetical protein